MMQVNPNTQLVDKIVHEVKSQGVFDEFRKDSMADVDTKPAYQNLRQRVEKTVKKFLSEQKWSPDVNKIQLREKLRKHITDSGFLDLGVERIVDQVVNPKIGTVFQPKIEDIAYKYLGVPKPIKPIDTIPMLHHQLQWNVNGNTLKIETSQLLPTDLEQVSPDSDIKSESKDGCIAMDLEEKIDDDDESPPFEPLEKEETKTFLKEEQKVLKKDGNFAIESNQHVNSFEKKTTESASAVGEKTEMDSETQDTSSVSLKTEEPESDKDGNNIPDTFQESQSQLSQVSSDSHLSIATHENNTSCCDFKSNDNAVNISEEAQMPKFNENSNDEDVSKNDKNKLHFDIKQDEIKFEGTKRISNIQSTELPPIPSECINSGINPDVREKIKSAELNIFEKKENDDSSNGHNFKFSRLTVESKEKIAHETSFSSSLDDSGTAQLCIVDKSENTQISNSDHHQALTAQSKESQLLSAISSNVGVNFAEKDYLPCEESTRNVSPSTSSSRHKKHSKHKKSEKDKYREKERDKVKDKDRERYKGKEKEKEKSRHGDKSSIGSSRHSSSSSKHHHLSSKHSGNDAKTMNSSSKERSHHKSKHSSSSSSSRSKSREESYKRHMRDGYSKQHSGSKDRPSSSTSSHKKKSNPSDDHYASKEKMRWRKRSTDSNDEDKKPEGDSARCSNKSLEANKNTTSETKTKNENGNRNIVSSSSPTSNVAKCAASPFSIRAITNNDFENFSKIVILNDLLANPNTEFIELGIASQAKHLHVASAEDENKKTLFENNNDNDHNHNQLYFYEENQEQFTERLKIIDIAMDNCRKVVNNLRFDDAIMSDAELSNDCVQTSASSHLQAASGKRDLTCGTRATLHIDCIRLKKTLDERSYDEEIEKKRFKYTPMTRVSPASSETSVNSKENEFIAADISAQVSDTSKKSLEEKRDSSITFTKLSHQQRYTSDDLYKPRPVLGQRSRRRGLFDSII